MGDVVLVPPLLQSRKHLLTAGPRILDLRMLLQYSPYLRNYTQSLEEASMSKVASSGPAVDLFKKTWNIATGQDV